MSSSTPTLDWLRARHAWVAALSACLINSIGVLVILYLGRDVPELPVWPVLASSAVGAALAALLLLRRNHASLASSSVVYVLNNTAVTLCVWFIIPAFAHSGAPWTPFQTNKLGMLIVAALAPELVPGLISIGCLAMCALARMSTLDAPSAVDEPAVLFIFGIVALVILSVRLRGLNAEFALAQTKAEADAATELSGRLLAMRDLANTPLQTIEIGVTLLQHRYPDAGDITDKVTRAIERMRGLKPLLLDPSSREKP